MVGDRQMMDVNAFDSFKFLSLFIMTCNDYDLDMTIH